MLEQEEGVVHGDRDVLDGVQVKKGDGPDFFVVSEEEPRVISSRLKRRD